jgi:2-iminobutanoate/2-iminopropanoate deaminase
MKYLSTDKAPAAIGPYSQGIIVNGIVYLSGQIPINPSSGQVEAKTIEEQTDRVCRNVGALLEAAGTSFDHVIKTTCFLAEMADFAAFNGVYGKYFISKPARSCIAAKALPKGVLVEVEVIAEI